MMSLRSLRSMVFAQAVYAHQFGLEHATPSDSCTEQSTIAPAPNLPRAMRCIGLDLTR